MPLTGDNGSQYNLLTISGDILKVFVVFEFIPFLTINSTTMNLNFINNEIQTKIYIQWHLPQLNIIPHKLETTTMPNIREIGHYKIKYYAAIKNYFELFTHEEKCTG